MKLENIPVALTTEMIDEYMKPVHIAAKIGDLSLIENMVKMAEFVYYQKVRKQCLISLQRM